MPHELQLLLLLAIIILVSKVAGHLSRLCGQPVVFGEILAGLLLGPSLLRIFDWPIFANSPVVGSTTLLQSEVHTLAAIGVLLLMFVAGLETNLQQMRRVGNVAFWAAIMGVVLPLGFGVIFSRIFGLNWSESMFIGAVLTATSVSISAQTLMELGHMRSREGLTILGAAVIDDVLGIIVLSFVIAFSAVGASGHAKLPDIIAERLQHLLHFDGGALLSISLVVLLMLVFFALAYYLASRFFGKVLVWADGLHASHPVAAAAICLIFLFAVGAEYIGQVAAITGAYLVGVFVGQTRYREEIEHAIHPFTYALFVPIFFMSIGLSANARLLTRESLLFTLVIVIVAILTKIIGCGLGARYSGFSKVEAVRVGVGMISRGEVGLIVAQVGLSAAIVRQTEYAAIVIMVLATTILTPLLLRLVFPKAPEDHGEVYESVVNLEECEDDEECSRS